MSEENIHPDTHKTFDSCSREYFFFFFVEQCIENNNSISQCNKKNGISLENNYREFYTETYSQSIYFTLPQFHRPRENQCSATRYEILHARSLRSSTHAI